MNNTGSDKLLTIDIDDTVLEWKKGYLKWMEEQGWVTKPEEECNVWEMSEWFLPHTDTGSIMTPEMSVKYITEFNTFPRVLRPLPNSQFTLTLIKNLGFDIKAITSFGSCPKNSKYRKEYLDVVFNDNISETVILDLGQCKKKTLEEMQPDFFVEDNGIHAKKAIDLGITTFLLSTPYNQGVEGAIYVDDWLDIYKIITYTVDESHSKRT